jgi:hypothetical protein
MFPYPHLSTIITKAETHTITDEFQYSNFVTPTAVAPIAQNIRNLTSKDTYGDEEFANAVLASSSKFPYVESDIRYPIETIVDNKGDCDTVSLLQLQSSKQEAWMLSCYTTKTLPT